MIKSDEIYFVTQGCFCMSYSDGTSEWDSDYSWRDLYFTDWQV